MENPVKQRQTPHPTPAAPDTIDLSIGPVLSPG
jgi:hypothetical protein